MAFTACGNMLVIMILVYIPAIQKSGSIGDMSYACQQCYSSAVDLVACKALVFVLGS